VTDTQPRSIRYVPLDEVVGADRNPRAHESLDKVIGSMRTYGFVDAAVHDGRTGKIIAGHGRAEGLAQMRDAGEPAPEGIVVDEDGTWRMPLQTGWSSRDDAAAETLLINLNRLVETGGWVTADLALLLDELRSDYPSDFALTGFTEVDLDAMLADLEVDEPEPLTDPDDVPPVPDEAVSQLGDVWLLGPHRLVCGDATDPDVHEVLLQGVRPNMLYVDPPYGMDLQTDYSRIGHHGGKDYRPVEGDEVDFDVAPFVEMYRDVAEQFWWGADYYRATLPAGGSWVVWDKRDNDQGMDLDELIGSAFELAWSRAKHQRRVARVLWAMTHGSQRETEDAKRGLHPTQKPVDLATWVFDLWGSRGDVVLDLFAGAGSTLIGCHAVGRVARLIEIDPRYVDVICARWERFTGVVPVLEATGEARSFA
jgi:hypothetical protein